MTKTTPDSSDNTTLPDPISSFRELNLPAPLLKATDELGFSDCTEIQGLTLPVISSGKDVAAQAQTGTGKTAAFLLGSFARLLSNSGGERRKDQPRMLVIAPTRELAMQIKKDADSLGAYTDLKCSVVYGGIDYDKQRKELAEGVDVLIGTPGRLIDYFKQKVFDLAKLEIVVLDEADRMFDLGFIADIRFLLRRMPAPGERLSMLFSATLSHRVMELAYEHMDNPQEIKTESTGVTAEGVRQALYQPATDEKIPLLLGLLGSLKPERSIIFVNTKRAAEKIESYLLGNDIACGTLSGDVRQSKRQKILADFTAGKLPILIATDVAARGLHIDDVSHVFNYDLPQQAEDYVHRIGRTARAGTKGVAVSFACENYSFSLPEIQEYIGQSIPLEMITDELLIKPKPPKRIEHDRVSSGPGGKGGKPSKGGSRDRGRSNSSGGGSRSAAPGSRSRRSNSESTGKPAADSSKPVDQTQSKPAADNAAPAPAPTDGAPAGSKPPRKRRPATKKPAPDAAASPTEGSAVSATGATADPAAKPPRKRRRRRKPAAAGESANATSEGTPNSDKGSTDSTE
ncbi:DEAD/DEAH box helicase [Granulosicoccus antarcticus]